MPGPKAFRKIATNASVLLVKKKKKNRCMCINNNNNDDATEKRTRFRLSTWGFFFQKPCRVSSKNNFTRARASSRPSYEILTRVAPVARV